MNIITGLITGMISGATPILLAALGGTFTYYAGVFNIAMEGMMLSGAFFGVLGSYYFQSWPMGILCAVFGALLMATIFIIFTVFLKTDEFVTGIALNLFAVGSTTYLLRQIFKVKGTFSDPRIISIPKIDIPFITNIPVLGNILSNQNLMIYVTVITVIVSAYVIFKTRFGLRLRAAGYNAPSLDSSGVKTATMRIWSLVICGVLCGFAGAYLSLGYVTMFVENMSAGRGWISLAAVILVNGNPWGIALISLVFGFTDGLGLFLQKFMPDQFTAMVPYIATLVSLYIYSIKRRKKAQ
jgi:simple sugar transport system permease protein